MTLPPSLQTPYPWGSKQEPLWIASSLILRRNLAQYNFPSKLLGPEGEQVVRTLSKELQNCPQIENPLLVPEANLSPIEKELIYEHFLLLRPVQKPPDGRTILLDDKGEFLTFLNGSNHLEMRMLHRGNTANEAWKKLATIEDKIGQSQKFAFLPKFGYLTADPAECGTALTLQIFLHLPALTHTNQLETALSNCNEEEIEFMGISGNLQDIVGDILILSNNYTIGMSEETILHNMEKAASMLIGAEKAMRTHLLETPSTEVQDLISKSFGLLVHSYKLETKEALDHLSTMKLGLALGLVKNVTDERLGELFFSCRRGHLLTQFPDKTDLQALANKRAEFLHNKLQGIDLVI